MRSERGFATIETLVAMGFVVAFMGAGLATVYLSFARAWLDRSAYEASVCLATDTASTECEREFRKALSNGLPVGDLMYLHLQRSPSFVGLSGRWSAIVNLELSFADRRSLPLTTSASRR